MVFGGIAAAIVIAIVVALHRIYKHFGRRCRYCGEIWKIRHVSKIRFPDGDSFVPKVVLSVIKQLVFHRDWKYFREHYRWWRRDALLVTYIECDSCKKKGEPHIHVVTISERSISLWHLFWVNWRKKKQFEEDLFLNNILERHVYDFYQRRCKPKPDLGPPPGIKATLDTEIKIKIEL